MRMAGTIVKTTFFTAALWFAVLAIVPSGALAQQAAPPAAAPAALEKPLWKDLSASQQLALQPLASEWDGMDAVRKQKWIDISNRFASLKPNEQQRVHERMRDWLKLTPEERRKARENYTLSKELGKNQKASKWEQYQQLPEEEKRKLAADAANKKQKITNLPPKAQPKAVTPLKPAPCKPGTVKNPNPAGPACIPGAAPMPPAVPPVTTPPPASR